MGMVGTRINNKLDRSFRKLCKDRGMTMAQGLAMSVESFVGNGLSGGMIKDDIKAEAETMLVSVATIEEKLEKVKQLEVDIKKESTKWGSRENEAPGTIFAKLWFYDPIVVNHIKHLKSELNTLLQEIEADKEIKVD